MPGGAEESDRVIASPQHGIKPGGVIGGLNNMDDPFLGVVNRHERFIDDNTGQPLNPELCRVAREGIRRFPCKGCLERAIYPRGVEEDGTPTHQC